MDSSLLPPPSCTAGSQSFMGTEGGDSLLPAEELLETEQKGRKRDPMSNPGDNTRGTGMRVGSNLGNMLGGIWT